MYGHIIEEGVVTPRQLWRAAAAAGGERAPPARRQQRGARAGRGHLGAAGLRERVMIIS